METQDGTRRTIRKHSSAEIKVLKWGFKKITTTISVGVIFRSEDHSSPRLDWQPTYLVEGLDQRLHRD